MQMSMVGWQCSGMPHRVPMLIKMHEARKLQTRKLLPVELHLVVPTTSKSRLEMAVKAAMRMKTTN